MVGGWKWSFFFFKIAQNLIYCSWVIFNLLICWNYMPKIHHNFKKCGFVMLFDEFWCPKFIIISKNVASLCCLMNFDRSYVGVWKIFGFSETFRKMHLECRFWAERPNLRFGPNGCSWWLRYVIWWILVGERARFWGFNIDPATRQIPTKWTIPKFSLNLFSKFNASRAIISYGIQPHGSIFHFILVLKT